MPFIYAPTNKDYMGEVRRTLYEQQKGECAVCRRKFPLARLAVDHDHGSGLVRGLLCTNCNTGLGHLGDSMRGLKDAQRYLADYENRVFAHVSDAQQSQTTKPLPIEPTTAPWIDEYGRPI